MNICVRLLLMTKWWTSTTQCWKFKFYFSIVALDTKHTWQHLAQQLILSNNSKSCRWFPIGGSENSIVTVIKKIRFTSQFCSLADSLSHQPKILYRTRFFARTGVTACTLGTLKNTAELKIGTCSFGNSSSSAASFFWSRLSLFLLVLRFFFACSCSSSIITKLIQD